ncbi:MAG: MarR family 2-MHQ and catechol resistance regulon transcriptional repressor [Saprospiraceae bacterium]|jgi:MarR family 2-MHQ and catechol resistance regulon transcriptional repressor
MRSFEDDLTPSKFKSQRQKGFLNILYTANFLRDKAAPFFKANGLLHQHYNILRIVKGKKGEPTSPGQIIEVMLDKGRDLTRLVDKLVKLGYLERRTSTLNRRKVEIFITAEGDSILKKIDENIIKFYDKMGIEEEEAKMLNKLLNKVRR